MMEHNDGLRVEVLNLSYSLKLDQQCSLWLRKQRRHGKQLLSNISFSVEKGELCGLMGSSGAGKR